MLEIRNKNVGVITAMKCEFDLIRESLTDVKIEHVFDSYFYIGKIGKCNVILVQSGIGKVNAAFCATILVDHFGCVLIVNSGIAGGIAPSKTRDVIVSSKLIYNDVDIRNFGYEYGQVPGMPKYYTVNPGLLLQIKKIMNNLKIGYTEGVIATGDKFALSLDILKDNDKGILAVDMEGCAVAQVATKAGVDFVVVRFISDLVGEESQIEKYDQFEEEMANESAKITLALFEALGQ